MKKFGIEVVKGNDSTLIKTFDTKEDGMIFGADYLKTMKREDGILSLFNAEFDENGQIVNNERRIYHVWY